MVYAGFLSSRQSHIRLKCTGEEDCRIESRGRVGGLVNQLVNAFGVLQSRTTEAKILSVLFSPNLRARSLVPRHTERLSDCSGGGNKQDSF